MTQGEKSRKMGSVRVASVRNLNMRNGEKAYYIGRGRAPAGMTHAHLGNPFPVGERYKQGEAAAAYEGYLRDQCTRKTAVHGMVVTLAKQLSEGQDMVLVCWCKHKGEDTPCHGDHLKKAVEGYAKALYGWKST